VWWACSSSERFTKASNRLLEYIGDYLQKPEYVIHVPESRTPRTPRGQPPEIFQAVCDVIAYTGWPEQKVWEMPIGSLYWYQVTFLKDRADVDIMSPEEREFQDQLAAKLAKDKENQSNGTR
jgi:hypothetical protein